MKLVILAGGLGTRLSEETTLKPKPMVEIGEFPILWHIMKIYSSAASPFFPPPWRGVQSILMIGSILAPTILSKSLRIVAVRVIHL